jgi:hypothetical protein
VSFQKHTMNKNYISADVSCSTLVVRASHLQRVATCLNRYLFKYWRLSLPCVAAALLLGATDAPASTITVTNGHDSGPGSLRQAILNASPGDTINFAPNVTTVNLSSDELIIDKNLRITGPFAHRVTVRRSTNSPPFRIFEITSGTVIISGLTISNGSASGLNSDGDGGGIRSSGILTLTDSTILGNQAVHEAALGGRGGGVLNDRGTMTITRCTIANNSALGGVSSSVHELQGSCGGGVVNNPCG